MALHIGKLIKQKVAEKEWSATRFAEKSGISYRSVMYLFNREDVSVEQLVHLSKVLEYDFLQHFGAMLQNSTIDSPAENVTHLHTAVPNGVTTMLFSLTISGDSHTFDRFPELFKKIRKEAERIGFKVH